jgi:DNA-binding protein HU-beta
MSSKKKSSKKKAASSSAPLTKTELIHELAEKTGQEQKAVKALMEAFAELAVKELKGPRAALKIPDIVNLKKVAKPAKPARQGRNPATGETIQIAAKPAGKKLRATFGKKIKGAVL